MNQLFIDYYWPLDILLHVLFILPVAGAILRWTSVWQIKEYRWDRLKDYFSTRSGKLFILSPWIFIEIVAGVYLLTAQAWGDSNLIAIIFLPWCVLIALECARVVRRPARPLWTTKTIITSLASFTTLAVLYVLIRLALPETSIPTSHFGVLSLLLAAVPLIVTIWIELLRPLVNSQKKSTLHQAKIKLQKVNPIVIGITGSFGKTSTKHFLKIILEKRWKVLATPKNINVDIGVAQTILSSLKEDHEILIVEMGAYRPGEIAAICNLVSPIIGVITAVSGQHLSLFGSLEIIKKTKAELLQCLPASGLAILNRDLQACREIAQYSPAPVHYFSVLDNAHIYATDIVVIPHQIKFTLHIGLQRTRAQVSLNGVQALPAVLAAVAVANHLAMPIEEIVAGLDRLSAPAGTMQLKNGRHHYSVIDDSYNANPDGFLAALDYLALFTDKRKIVITPGMLELGTDSDKHHRSVGQRIAEVADLLIITKRDFSRP
ncbi:MAG: hypothetical protein CO132_05375, partial [Candidatus Kerfeldbacteria bacterium CG_4_9_14_3_um_filter_45_8]